MVITNIIALILVFCGSLNWGLVGIFNFNLVETIFGGYNVGSIIVYILVFVAGLWLVISPFFTRGKLYLCEHTDREISKM